MQEVLRSPGQPLDAATRGFMEPRFGQDFSGVRVHTDAGAAASARDVNAHTYTVGHNMVFGAGRFAPGTDDGQRLIAHELTHVVQQSGAMVEDQTQTQLQMQPSPQERRSPLELKGNVIPQELRSSVNVQLMKPAELQARYDLIAQTMKHFNASTSEYMTLELELHFVVDELARRQASGATGQPF